MNPCITHAHRLLHRQPPTLQARARLLLCGLLLAPWALLPGLALASVTEEELRQLGSSLTAVGAIRDGNRDGSIPPYQGGLQKPPADYRPRAGARGGAPYVDPYAADKPLFSITAANMEAYAEQLDEGSKVLLKRFPATYRMDIYPSHRSAAYPAYALANTLKHAARPQLVGNGMGISGAHAQVPFPIPKSGLEALWNAQLHYVQPWEMGGAPIHLLDAAGNRTVLAEERTLWEHAYWDDSRPSPETYLRLIGETKRPAARVGSKLLARVPLRLDRERVSAWVYIPGQRRVRLAPELQYDSLLPQYGGMLFADEASGLSGKMDRFDFRLVGRREMFVPYNAYRFAQAPPDAGTLKQHHNPDVMRFELHRVWVVEGTLKAGQRHANSKKTFLLDEDSWVITTYWSHDAAGKPFRLMLNGVFTAYDIPAVRNEAQVVYDLIRGGYLYGSTFYPAENGFVRIDPPANPDAFFSPDALAGGGVR